MINKTILKNCCSEGFDEVEVYKAYKIFFGTLVSESRLKIINLLRTERKNVGQIVEELKSDQTSVSHDLARLKKCSFVQMEIEGKYRYYCLNKKTINPLMKLIDEHMSENCIHILNKTYNKKGKTK
ncbi:MAG: metalloregulator ArsR/SmtB family transcription factor [Candidatus Nanoarchaeia archaeon]|jgi:DNA-binding transcriptional ArsR family regulator|nr:metalloregulator ArsR/SmtB family transcription factor [Candidatus Nanoarchaeia archaeon]|tara:strand:- start:91 stop:468 length:378 start_codon:yes stop_codon:yes gene_type:complete